MITINDLFIYPFKSAQGVRLGQSRVEARGLSLDRRWMAVDIGGKFLSQRTHPRLGAIRVAVSDTALLLSAPGMEELSLPLSFTSPYRRNVVVWDDCMSALECGTEAHEWISTLLGQTASIVYFPDSSVRFVDPRYASEGEHTAFADAFPVLVLSQASLDDLNARLALPLPMDRFRPNLVIAGCAAYEEDAWGTIRIGSEVELELVKPCARCAIVTIDQQTLESGDEPLRTLSRYRASGAKVLFGQNALVRKTGVIRTGDAVRLQAERRVV